MIRRGVRQLRLVIKPRVSVKYWGGCFGLIIIIVFRVLSAIVINITIINMFVSNDIDWLYVNILTRWFIQLFVIFKFIELFECLTVKIFYDIFQLSYFVFQFINRFVIK